MVDADRYLLVLWFWGVGFLLVTSLVGSINRVLFCQANLSVSGWVGRAAAPETSNANGQMVKAHCLPWASDTALSLKCVCSIYTFFVTTVRSEVRKTPPEFRT